VEALHFFQSKRNRSKQIMPIFNEENMETHSLGGTGFQFSATRINELGASEYTLVGIAVDRSGSLMGHDAEIEKCLKSVVESCAKSPRANNLMLRVVTFDHHLTEVHGFQELSHCHLAGYDGATRCGGGTALYDAIVNVAESLAAYGRKLIDEDYSVNGALYVLTDGMDEHSTLTVNAAKEAMERALSSESLESLASVLVGVNTQNQHVAQYLEDLSQKAQFRQYVGIDQATPAKLAKLGEFISRSISSQSQSLGTGGPSQPLAF
jgi:uncharacterized protein YegL